MFKIVIISFFLDFINSPVIKSILIYSICYHLFICFIPYLNCFIFMNYFILMNSFIFLSTVIWFINKFYLYHPFRFILFICYIYLKKQFYFSLPVLFLSWTILFFKSCFIIQEFVFFKNCLFNQPSQFYLANFSFAFPILKIIEMPFLLLSYC